MNSKASESAEIRHQNRTSSDTGTPEPGSEFNQAMNDFATRLRENKAPKPSPADTVISLPSGDALHELEKYYQAGSSRSPESPVIKSREPGCVFCSLQNRLSISSDVPLA
jgi:hypothetical protein